MTVPTEQRTTRKRRTATAASAGADPEGLRAQGLRTRNAILRVARKLLLEGGSLEFSLRAVALGAGISISNLQYYFPTRQAVLRAIMAPIIDAYLEDLKRALDSRLSPREALDALLEKALADARNVKDSALWWHFVSLASTDPECARMFDEWYDTLTRGIAELVRAVNPQLKTADSLHAASLLIALADGLALQLGAGRRKRAYPGGLDEVFRATVNHIVLGERSTEEAS
ncbi:TetR/AcrR family transcriptional regulator [Cupriavidus sp. WGtm5]|uniref:TetR/AcrR family transcriptional regulator n=1 Tax=Cupriavidus sp. WGtm5 TaxID=2919926 RepID=UPI000E10E38D|nr:MULTISPECIES: TetR/AcrR family transcriptional regulator [Cupriavidus]MCO4893154.1 TetR/AcrR family transcriptional regulator [Cupriavidus sp. WGtm5]SPA41160.1 TetR family transcriptional regulator [Cupriavidus taiwanensis]